MRRTVPHSADTPKFWRYETGGELTPAVQRYLRDESLTIRQVGLLKAYLQQWVESSAWDENPHAGPDDRFALSLLRNNERQANTLAQLDGCIQLAVDLGMDPL
jgi:hypothetical protein